MRRMFLLAVLLLTAACDIGGPVVPAPVPGAEDSRHAFARVVGTVEPEAEAECRRQTSGVSCDFQIFIDPDPRAQPNAYQSLDAQGRPVITFTLTLIDSTRNADELAFVLSHETAHHILGHLERQARNAAAGAAILGGMAARDGASPRQVMRAQELGAALGARSFSKDFELEADQLGTVIAYHAGYDPLRGANYFDRLPDPGDEFLGSHPPNAERRRVVVETMQQLRQGAG